MAARTLACTADVLGAMAGERAGLRSGPARNESWMQALQFLEVCGNVEKCASFLHLIRWPIFLLLETMIHFTELRFAPFSD